jgi:hypothetical protein
MILTAATEVLGEKHTASVVVECVWNIGGMIVTGATKVL